MASVLKKGFRPNKFAKLKICYPFILAQLFAVLAFTNLVSCQLVINVKNKGGDLIQESLNGNPVENTITLKFQKLDGTLLDMLIDFKSEVQIFKMIVLGEEERADESQYQTMCFIFKFLKSEFISADAMSKLRQKNPGTIRNPEEDKGEERLIMNLGVDVSLASRFSPWVLNVCSEAKGRIFTRDSDLKAWAAGNNATYTALLDATHSCPLFTTPRCDKTKDTAVACVCRLPICVGWYPCGLKYCRGRDSAGKTVSYRCGIKTCRKCRVFDYYVEQKLNCMWESVY
ncbi:out at first protein-like [Acanthaster planci]|uniref:Out at first protein-like n=1 Tax=Acanthaster planci TaxID=133434 RepID=A0A8B7YYY2_ACAPL|nr:out at first protein-like [Acanthaster planci]